MKLRYPLMNKGMKNLLCSELGWRLGGGGWRWGLELVVHLGHMRIDEEVCP
jgi:hypothetical protein